MKRSPSSFTLNPRESDERQIEEGKECSNPPCGRSTATIFTMHLRVPNRRLIVEHFCLTHREPQTPGATEDNAA
ncbi:hypothetical protein TNCV_2735511 [Trichonephila clavipes]|nr:hypothetical protein TNCV_2735511 [Trichonephila clavipes]